MTISDTTRTAFAGRVQLGAKYLDNIDTYWYRQIDVDKLNLFDDCGCVLGQLHGEFANGLVAKNLTEGEAVYFGLYLPNGDTLTFRERYELLTELWREEILRRLGTPRG